jgi:hypothetical protein
MRHTLLKSAVFGVGALALSSAGYAADQSGSMSGPSGSMSGPNAMSGSIKGDATSGMMKSDVIAIASAMSAAPKAVSGNATIMMMEPGGTMRTLRKGTNGYTCIPDDPQTPGPDPMCMDKNSMAFIGAMAAHKPPPQGKVGFMYMLEGGTDASNTDPYAAKPTAANHWIKTGPHIMIMGAGKAFLDQYPKSADPDTKAPYVMWAGTPYEHLMVPVK